MFTASLRCTWLVAPLPLARRTRALDVVASVFISFPSVEVGAELGNHFRRLTVVAVGFAAAQAGVAPALPAWVLTFL